MKCLLISYFLYEKRTVVFSYLLYCQTSTSAVLHLESVMSMPTARILLVLIFVRAKLDTVEMEKHAKVRMVYSM